MAQDYASNQKNAHKRLLDLLKEAGEPKSIAWLQKQAGYSFRALRELEHKGKVITFFSADGEHTMVRLGVD